MWNFQYAVSIKSFPYGVVLRYMGQRTALQVWVSRKANAKRWGKPFTTPKPVQNPSQWESVQRVPKQNIVELYHKGGFLLKDTAVKLGVSIPTLTKLFEFYGLEKYPGRGRGRPNGGPGRPKQSPGSTERKEEYARKIAGGYKNPFSTLKTKTKIKAHWLNLGVSNPSQLPDIQAKIKDNSNQRYGVDSPSQLPEVKAKARMTNLSRYGSINPMQNVRVKAQAKATSLAVYGNENPSKSSAVIAKIMNTQKRKYGGIGMSSPFVAAKIRKTNRQRYGVDNPAANDTIKQKIERSFKYYNFVFPSGRVVRVQGYERHFIEYLLSQGVIEEDIIIRPSQIPYLHPSGRIRNYRPDLLVRPKNLL